MSSSRDDDGSSSNVGPSADDDLFASLEYYKYYHMHTPHNPSLPLPSWPGAKQAASSSETTTQPTENDEVGNSASPLPTSVVSTAGRSDGEGPAVPPVILRPVILRQVSRESVNSSSEGHSPPGPRGMYSPTSHRLLPGSLFTAMQSSASPPPSRPGPESSWGGGDSQWRDIERSASGAQMTRVVLPPAMMFGGPAAVVCRRRHLMNPRLPTVRRETVVDTTDWTTRANANDENSNAALPHLAQGASASSSGAPRSKQRVPQATVPRFSSARGTGNIFNRGSRYLRTLRRQRSVSEATKQSHTQSLATNVPASGEKPVFMAGDATAGRVRAQSYPTLPSAKKPDLAAKSTLLRADAPAFRFSSPGKTPSDNAAKLSPDGNSKSDRRKHGMRRLTPVTLSRRVQRNCNVNVLQYISRMSTQLDRKMPSSPQEPCWESQKGQKKRKKAGVLTLHAASAKDLVHMVRCKSCLHTYYRNALQHAGQHSASGNNSRNAPAESVLSARSVPLTRLFSAEGWLARPEVWMRLACDQVCSRVMQQLLRENGFSAQQLCTAVWHLAGKRVVSRTPSEERKGDGDQGQDHASLPGRDLGFSPCPFVTLACDRFGNHVVQAVVACVRTLPCSKRGASSGRAPTSGCSCWACKAQRSLAELLAQLSVDHVRRLLGVQSGVCVVRRTCRKGDSDMWLNRWRDVLAQQQSALKRWSAGRELLELVPVLVRPSDRTRGNRA